MNLLEQLKELSRKRKTYAFVSIGLGVIGAVMLGWVTIDPKLYQDIINAITLAAIAALRAGIK